MHAYNDEKKNFVLIHSPKIPGVSQGIGSYLVAIIQDDDNDNIRFYLQDITQAYIEIVLDLNLDFYIRPLSELISKLSASFDSIVKVMRPLYGEPEADNHRFAIYHPHYKENSGMTESAHDPFLLRPPPEIDEIRWICGEDNPADAMTKASPNSALERIISTNKATIRLEGWVKQ